MDNDFELMNKFGKEKIPFFFIISYNKKEVKVIDLEKLADYNIFFKINQKPKKFIGELEFSCFPVEFDEYYKKFEAVQKYLKNGYTYLLNLTFSTPIQTNLSLADIYEYSSAEFSLLFQDNFVCFSPEKFIEIKDNKIFTNPMKGTIDAKVPNAEKVLINNKKEIAEHYTIVDLLRNDLTLVAKKVRVEKFRYIEKIKTNNGEILQSSSLISGFLENNWTSQIGEILDKLTPAGSVTGAPKIRTCQIINEIENYSRGFYTGIAGIFDGSTLISFVLIRFIEKIDNNLYFKSGGGITTLSNAEDEYRELKRKIYVPIVRNH